MTDFQDIAELQELLEFQQVLIERIASGTPIRECLDAICLAIENVFSEQKIKSSILLLCDGHLYIGAGPNIDDEYHQLIDGIAIGPNVGSCGTTAYYEKPTIVVDVYQSEEWSDFLVLAEQFGFRSCWSFHVGSMHRVPRAPSSRVQRTSSVFSRVIQQSSALSYRVCFETCASSA